MKRQGIERARRLRREQTEAEGILWSKLRSARLAGMKFRRQHSVGPFIADFACLDRKLIIELDGSQHTERTAGDERRTSFLSREGYWVIRFWNREVLTSLNGVLETILANGKDPLTLPSPRRGEG